eukprot:s3976_g2.t1
MTKEKFQTHALLYQQHRADLMEALNSKLEELSQVKKEVSVASQTLLQEEWMAPVIPAQPDIAAQMTDLHGVMQEGANGEQIDLTMLDDEEIELMDGAEPLGEVAKRSTSKILKPFRGAVSPTKVANHNLKQKPEKEAKSKEEK